ncbi:MAG: ParB/RepB/Spo0J family partition protein [candidate division Zixibacteria bacterium]|nr:ParB/RepB/Spo0J family partition protein [candidate division Zixibacteria bacterium]
MSKQVLGRGLGALIPSHAEPEGESARFQMIPLTDISPNPMQPRQSFDSERLNELAESLKKDGMMQPLVLKKNGSGYHIIAGERRYRAAKLAGLDKVPAAVMEHVDDTRMLELALIENVQREDLNPMELAEAYRRLIEQCGLTQQQLSERIGKSRTAITNQLRLLRLPESVARFVRDGRLTEGHARSLLALSSEDDMLRMAEQVVDGALSVRQVEGKVSTARKRRLIPKRKLPALADAETYLKRLMGTSVKIVPGLKRGRIEIEYYNDDDLNRLLELFARIE